MRAYKLNPRQISQKQLSRLRESLNALGDLSGVVENVAPADVAPVSHGQVVGGHQRLRAMFGENAGEFALSDADVEIVKTYNPPTEQGTTAEGFIVWRGQRFAFRRVAWDDEKFKRANFAANQQAGEWDWDTFANIISADDLTRWGYNPAEWLAQLNRDAGALSKLVMSENIDKNTDAEPRFEIAEELRERWGTARGQVWRLGAHRVMCGDCTNETDAAYLFSDERAALTFTSPPYWVGKDYERETTIAEVEQFIRAVSVVMAHFTRRDYSRIVINSSTGMQHALKGERGKVKTMLLIDRWTNTLELLGWNLRHVRHWLKHGGLTSTAAKSDMIDQHCEFLCAYDTPEGSDYDRFDDDEIRLAMTFYEPNGKGRGQEKFGGKSWVLKAYWDDIRGNANSDGHVAAMPLMVAVRHVLMYSKRGEIIFEPFLGSGTTLIACENLGRVCYGMEIEPKYAAVSIQRWVDATGGTPELLNP